MSKMKIDLTMPFPAVAEHKGGRMLLQSKTVGWTDISCQLPVNKAEKIDYAAYRTVSGRAP
ncbi:MAG: hypothetical protein ACI4WY_07250 [Anaerovoracaceae bacterium]